MGSEYNAESTMTEKSMRQGSPGKLNVILHGLFAFDQNDKEIVAYIPNLGSEHLYKAGNWLAETNLEERADLELKGVDSTKLGRKDIDQFSAEDRQSLKVEKGVIKGFKLREDQNLILGNVTISSNAKECHCIHATIRLPYPPYPIRSLRRIRIPADALGGDDKTRVIDGNKMANGHKAVNAAEVDSATVQVLTYDFDNDADLQLVESGDHDAAPEGHPWE